VGVPSAKLAIPLRIAGRRRHRIEQLLHGPRAMLVSGPLCDLAPRFERFSGDPALGEPRGPSPHG
jgi:hypothetical protein